MKNTQRGFTLIELSIVLVIIGLIVGGVLVGQNLITAAAVRAQVAQIEKYNTAANAFYGKYGFLPGDLPAAPAQQFGFIARGSTPGKGDGNGVIEGYGNNNCGFCEGYGETVTFWVDLATAHLIDGNFTTASETTRPSAPLTGSGIGTYIPEAKIGNGNYVYVWSGGMSQFWNGGSVSGADGANYFGLSAVSQISGGCCGWPLYSVAGITVAQSYAIDKKVDDGYPQSGKIIAAYLNGDVPATLGPVWAGSGGQTGGPYKTATTASATSCFDNGNSAGVPQTYSLAQNNGNGVNCAVSFKMQAGD